MVPVVAGHAGAWLVEALATERIPTRAVRVAGETRTCLSILDRSTGRLTEVYEPGPPIDARGWAELEAAVAAELETDGHRSVVVLSGSLLAGAPSDGYARIVALAHREHARSVVDADGDVLARAIAAVPWLARVNAERGRPRNRTRAGRRSRDRSGRAGAQDGRRGDRDRHARRRRRGAGRTRTGWRGASGPPPERGPYPVGSGDSFLAGFLAAHRRRRDRPRRPCRQAVAAGAANALRPGQGAIDPADVARICRVTLAPIGAAYRRGLPRTGRTPSESDRPDARTALRT